MKSNNYFTHSHKTLFLIIISLGFSLSIFSQDYAYIIESFEDPLWATVDNNPTTISMPSGQWTCYKDNVHTTEVGATDGIYSLLFTRKDGLLSPFLTNGVGLLTFSAIKNTGGTRTIYIETSIDNEDWELIESYNTQQEWEEKTVKVNDANIRYLRFRTNSNGSTFIDKVLMTKAGANDIKVITYPAITISQNSAIIQAEITTGESYQIIERGVCYNTIGNPDYDSDLVISHEVDNNIHVELNHLLSNTIYYAKAYAKTDAGVNYGNEISFTTRVGDEEIIYWVQPFDDTSYFPGSSPTTPQSIQVTGQGEWIYYKAYKNTNASYIIDDSPYGIRMLKNGSYVITPTFEDGVAKVYFDEGRTGKTITIYTSIDNGETWINHSSIVTDKSGKNSIIINSDKVNRIKIANDSGNDADIDNLSVTVFPSGIRPEVFTGDVIDISTNRATVSGQLISQGDKTVIERGICWSTQPIPLIGDNKNRYSGNDDSYTMDINDLPAMQQIYYRAYAFSRAGTGYGEIKSFLTQEPSIPELITLTATQITGETALVGASITNLGGGAIIEMGVCWSMEANSSINDNLILTQGDKTGFNVIIQPLTANTTYYYRSFVKTNGGIGYGQEETLTTGSISLPVVATNSTSAISPFQIKAEGTLMDNGNAIITKGFCWAINKTPSINDNKITIDDNEINFEAILENLKSNTTYHICAFATNTIGTVYGDEIIVTTHNTKTYYVSPLGNDETADGTEEKPYYSLHNVVDLVSSGDKIIMKDGTYHYTTRINISSIGQAGEGMISLRAEDGKRALLDFSAMPCHDDNQGIRLTGSYWHIYGLDIKGAGDNGMLIERNKPSGGTYADVESRTHEAHHNIIEFCSFFENQDTGMQLKNLAENNRIINCDSYYNTDPSMGDADGFAPKLTLGSGNYFYGCRAWNNSDDGWDGYLKATEGGFPDDITTVLENCWAFNNGYLKDGSESKGNGNGFKMGGNYQRHNMILKRCLGFNNLVKTYDQNHNTGDMILINCTGFAKRNTNSNQRTYRIDEDVADGKQILLVNCVAVWDGLDRNKSAYAPVTLAGHTEITCDFLTTESDFVSCEPIGVDGPRKADGSLPDIDFMKIKPGNTKLIDAGTQVDGIEYQGSAPDLGWLEYVPDATSIEQILAEKTENTSMTIYPQPIQDYFTVLLNNEDEPRHNRMKIFDVNGLLVYQEDFYGNSMYVKCSNVKSGVYVLIVNNSNSVYSQKIVVK